MSDAPPPPVKARRSGCQWLPLVAVFLMSLAAPTIQSIVASIGVSDRRERNFKNQRTTKHLQESVLSFKSKYQNFPLAKVGVPGRDLTLRSRGLLLQALIGEDAGGLNPNKIPFLHLPAAKDRQLGLWMDGQERVLSDSWGEPFYIVLDTSGDHKIANPEYGADQSDLGYAKHCQISPPPATLPAEALIYSAGPDRDPRTWKDNLCSWRLF